MVKGKLYESQFEEATIELLQTCSGGIHSAVEASYLLLEVCS